MRSRATPRCTWRGFASQLIATDVEQRALPLAAMKSIALIMLVALTACAAVSPHKSARRNHDVQDVRAVLDWLIGRAPLKGFDEKPADAWILDRARRILVVCDHLPPELELSSDARVLRPTSAQLDALWEKHAYDKTVYVWITRIPRYTWGDEPPEEHRALRLKYVFGNVGAQYYEFGIWRDRGVVRAAGFLTGSS